MYGTVSVVSADNLGSLALGGFKESCSAYRCSRHCLATQVTAKCMVHPLLPGTCTCITSFVGSFQSVYSSINFPKNVMNLIKIR